METARLKLVLPSMDIRLAVKVAVEQSQAALREFVPWVSAALDEQLSIADTKQMVANHQCGEGELRFILVEKSSEQVIGAIALIVGDKQVPAFEIGYWLHSDYVGHGYISEALTALEHHAFVELGAKRVEIRAAATNSKSRAVAERSGYQLEGTLHNARRLPSGELDATVIYAKTQLLVTE